MRHTLPRDIDSRRVRQLLSQVRIEPSIGGRIDILSQHFVGYPYKANPLIGAVDSPEVFTASLDAFDCVTYIETILALSCASNVVGFSQWLKMIRYEHGKIR